MPLKNENHENPGIFVRIFDNNRFDVLWLDGHGVIEMAHNEEFESGEAIEENLIERSDDSYAREMYNPWGQYEGIAVLRRLTLYESVHYLGRHARICAFLRPKVQADRFIQGLEKSKDRIEHQVASVMRKYVPRFEEEPQARMTQELLQKVMEEQLLNITTD